MKYKLINGNSDSIFDIFKNRNINPNTILNLSEKDINDPFLMNNMKEAVEKVLEGVLEEIKKFL